MPNFNGGKKYKRKKKNNEPLKRQMVFKSEGSEYGQISKALGSCRFNVSCCDGKERLGQLRASKKKQGYLRKDDWVLIGLRDYETSDNKCDIMYKYFPEEVLILRKNGYIKTDLMKDKEEENEIDENMSFDFGDI